MVDGPDVDETFLTDRQAEVLALRHRGLTQQDIADSIGTSVSNVSAIDQAARRNIDKAGRTLELAAVLRSADRFRIEAGTDLREVIDRVYEQADAADLKINYTEPELSRHLQDRFGDRLEGRALTVPVEIGLTAEGDVVTYVPDMPPAVDR